MHVVCVSYFYDLDLTDPQTLLARYGTLTGWAESLLAAGAQVSVVQRFGQDLEYMRNGVLYRFVRDPAERFGNLRDKAPAVNRAVAALHPDFIHAHGTHFARQTARLKGLLPKVPILLQDHAGFPPQRWISRWTLKLAMCSIDAVSFTVLEQVTPWWKAGIIGKDKRIVLLPEGSSPFHCYDMAEAQAQTGLCGEPQCLWVGRLNRNKDPLTILRGFAIALAQLPKAHLAMVYDEEELLPEVQGWLKQHPGPASRIRLLGKRTHAEIEALQNSSHFYLLGSDYDGGSGYSVLEALSCGVIPQITDIPSFRAITVNGRFGGLWPVGDANALAESLIAWNRRWSPFWRERVRAYFDEALSFDSIGRQALAAYQQILEGRKR